MKVKCLLAAVLALCPTVAWAQTKSFGNIGGYEIVGKEASKEAGGICGMRYDFEGPGETFIWVWRSTKSPELIFLNVANENWSIDEDKEYEVEYELAETVFERSALGMKFDFPYRGFAAGFPMEQFSTLFAKSTYLHINHKDGRVIDRLNLSGSSAAIKILNGACWNYAMASQKAVDAENQRWEHIPEDPFKK